MLIFCCIISQKPFSNRVLFRLLKNESLPPKPYRNVSFLKMMKILNLEFLQILHHVLIA
jgi:hypothetical protein